MVKSLKTHAFVFLIAALGLIQLAAAGLSWRNLGNTRFFLYLFAVTVSSLFPLKRAGNGVSLSLPFVLLGIVDLNVVEAVMIGCTSVLLHSLRSARREALGFQVVVSVAVQALVIATAKFMLESVLPSSWNNLSVRVLAGTATLFAANTLPVAMALRLNTKPWRLGRIWKESYFWSFPFYLVSGALAVLVHRAWRGALSPEDSLLIVVTIFLAHRYYRSQRAQRDAERERAGQMAALHLRTIEGLALAVEAKDNLNTRWHLRRVQAYSLAIGRAMGLTATEMEALRAGALLHDIGKLAVPEHILTKPGKLTPEEFARMKVHPLVGAEIVEQIQFPYPVAPIVREHHEKWNGSGYPFGLKGEEISIGGRILAAVDCLDALTSDREYRQGILLDQAMEYIASESGKSFDPQVVNVLRGLYRSLARQVDAGPGVVLSTEAKIDNAAVPAAGLDLWSVCRGETGAPGFLSAIAAAGREEGLLWKMASSVAVLEIDEVLPRIHQVLESMIPHAALVFFRLEANALRVEFSTGLNHEDLSYLEVPMGEGLTGWVAQNRQTVVNGNPAVDPGFLCDTTQSLKSALSIPLEGSQGLIGVLALYRTGKDAFNKEDLRILHSVQPNISLALENALKYRETQRQAKIDPITGLPGLELFRQTVAEELARGRRNKESLCLLVVEMCEFQDLFRRLGKRRTDELITTLATGIKSSCREYDRIARIGLASFGLVLPGMKAGYLAQILDRIEALVSDRPPEDWVSVAFGGAFYPEDGDGARQMLAVAEHRARSLHPKWTESIRALADSVGERSRPVRALNTR
jgi:diguanylate cyclase (GGDEF)-like protein/putative nucleotidyltransferase with HDIG domain